MKLDPTQPLWMPPGSVRAMGFLLMLISLIYFTAMGIDPPKEMWTLFGGIVGWYFGTKTPINGADGSNGKISNGNGG